ncbi:MAG TPA: class I SAM-dependent rRNA methyltransferase [Anaerolineales bacterium]|nr:class I SAM-dependent rRNA methyltransferase [Anaerolineales bacterium]
MDKQLILKPGRERSVQRFHPWIFSGSVGEARGEPASGDTVDVLSHTGEWLARAAYSPQARIAARIWTWNRDEPVDRDFLAKRLERALEARAALARDPEVTAYREVHAESDGLPGLVVDRYGEVRVVQFLSAGVEAWRETIIDLVENMGPCSGIFERSDVDTRQREGLPPRSGLLYGQVPELVEIREGDMRFAVDVGRGQKTGFYLDQRDSRQVIRRLHNAGRVLNAFCYTGSFTVAALRAGAQEALSIDSSAEALELARENVRRNGLDESRALWKEGNVFQELRTLRDKAETFDTAFLDPPRFAAAVSQVSKAARAYKDVNLLAFKLLRPGGRLVTFSCSSGVSPDLFQQIVAAAALDAGVQAQIVGWLGQPADHPVGIHFPEGRYLKGLIVRVGS